MKTIYLITMWSGGRPAKKWTSYEEPQVLSNGQGVTFTARESKLSVTIIGPISVEEFESGKEEMESGMFERRQEIGEDVPPKPRLPRPPGEPFEP